MRQSFSIRDIELLGYIEPKEEHQSEDVPYQIFSASTIAGLKKINAKFLYLKSNCSKRKAEEIARNISKKDDLYIIVPKSGINMKTLRDFFPKDVPIFIYEDLIWDKVKSTFSDYINALKTDIVTERYYVPPRKEDGDPKKRLDDEIFERLIGERDNKLMIVCASAGVGKTTLARELTVKLANLTEQNRIIPTYVEASHWGKLKLESIDEFWEIIENSLRKFRNLTINEDLFEYCLKSGYLVFIFDGFDELCSQRYSLFNPREILQRLADISIKSNAKIIITTRTLYWEAEIHEPPKNVYIFNLAPFNTQQAKGYFDKFFIKDPKSCNRAFSLYSELIKSNVPPTPGGSRVQFVNLPLCVGMIAEYVRLGATGDLTPQSGKGLVRGILYQICDREKERKNLLTSAEKQLKAFEEITIDQSETFIPIFDLELLEIAGFNTNDIHRITDHPLITTDDGKQYRFNYDFLPQYLKAFFLSNAILSCDTSFSIWKIMNQESNGKGYIIEHMLELLSEGNINYIKKCFMEVPSQFAEAKSFLFHLVKNIIDRSDSFVTKDERTAALFSVFSDNFNIEKEVRRLYIIGNIEGLNLSGVTFTDCILIDSIFTKCDANDKTTFNNCKFSGEMDFQYCDKAGWSQVNLNNCTLLPPSNLVWEEILGVCLGSKEENVIDALRLALGKFWHYGQLKRSIRKNNWHRGSLGHSIYCKKILKAMLKIRLIEEMHISGVSEDGYVFSMEYITDLQRFMDNRQLTGKIREVFNSIIIE